MNEAEARDWIAARYGSDKVDLLDRYVAILIEANQTQNLISKATEPSIWVRHILDSAQLTLFAPDAESWIDVGSGAGLPGIVLAAVLGAPVLMIEPRRKRAEFLGMLVDRLGLGHATVRRAMVERVSGPVAGAITARAYAPLATIFSSTRQLTAPSTIWVLPNGRGAETKLEEARQTWQGVFHVEQSLTDEDARIIVARDVRPR